MSGLTLVTVPIGNMEDITVRAKAKLAECSVIVAEDTRVVKELLQRLELSYQDKQIFSFHDHSEESSLKGILKVMREKEVIYVSDAGSPLISDPAFPLARMALDHGIELQTLPGVTSVMAALELSALPATPFHFHGFAGRDKVQDFAKLVHSQYGTHIFFEGVSRVMKTLELLTEEFPEWDFAVCRELTKTHQSSHRFKGKEFEEVSQEMVVKGEFVILLHNPNKKAAAKGNAENLAQEVLQKGAKPKLLAKLLSELTGLSSKEVYQELEEGRKNSLK